MTRQLAPFTPPSCRDLTAHLVSPGLVAVETKHHHRTEWRSSHWVRVKSYPVILAISQILLTDLVPEGMEGLLSRRSMLTGQGTSDSKSLNCFLTTSEVIFRRGDFATEGVEQPECATIHKQQCQGPEASDEKGAGEKGAMAVGWASKAKPGCAKPQK